MFNGRAIKKKFEEHFVYLNDVAQKYPKQVKDVKIKKKELKAACLLRREAKERYNFSVAQLCNAMFIEGDR